MPKDYIHVNDLAVGLKALEKLSYEDKIITNLATGKANSVKSYKNNRANNW